MLKKTKHATTNYRRLKPLLDGLGESSHRRYEVDGHLPLVVEKLYDDNGATVYSLTHYGMQNGDPMRDPDMELRVDPAAGTVEPLTYRNDYMGRFDQVYTTRNGKKLYSPYLRTSLDDFLWHWLQNIESQGYTA